MNDEPHSPLNGVKENPLRSAAASFRGDMFQVWHSLHAWITLKPAERLFLERGEDFDIARKSAIDLFQTKDLSSNITLRSECVREAIDNFWNHKQNNPGISIRFRFLTTADVGVEKGAPFGAISGLNHWRYAQTDQKAASELKSFLLEEGKLAKSTLAFIEKTELAEFQRDLLIPIKWITKSSRHHEVKMAVRNQLVYYGEERGIGPSDCEAAMSALYQYCCEAIVNGITKLERIDFLLRFENATTNRVSKSTFRNQNREASPPTNFLPVVQRGVLHRPAVLSRLLVLINQHDLASISALSGSGKTQIALSVYATRPETCRWIDCGRLEPKSIANLLQYCAVEAGRVDVRTLWILDSIDFAPGKADQFTAALSTFVFEVRARNGSVLFTSTKFPTPGLRLALGMHSDSELKAPPLTKDEIEEFAISLGCPNNLSKKVADYCRGITAGHAQCVHAFLDAARNVGWDAKVREWLSKGMTAVEELQEGVFDLLGEVLNDSQKQLLVRISLIEGHFRKDHVLEFSQIDPKVGSPGDKFKGFCGPWIEKCWDDYFAVSPLLEGYARRNHSEEEIRSIKIKLADAFIKADPLSTVEGSNMLRLLLDAEDEARLIPVISNLMEFATGDTSGVYLPLAWFAYRSATPGQTIYPANLALNSILRCLQFHVARDVDFAQAEMVAAVWHDECFCESRPETPGLPMEQFFLLVNVLLFYQIKVPPYRLIKYIGLLLDFQKTHPEMISGFWQAEVARQMSEAHSHLPQIKTLADGAALFLLARFDTPTEIESLFDAIEGSDTSVRGAILSVWRDLRAEVAIPINRVWLSGENVEPPIWTDCLRILQKIAALFAKWDLVSGCAAAIRGVGVVWDEYLGDRETALFEVEQLRQSFGIESPVIDYAVGNILFNSERFDESIPCFESVISASSFFDPICDIEPFQSSRLIGMICAKRGDYNSAAKAFLDAAGRCSLEDYPQFRVGLVGDAAIAYFEGATWQRSVDTFVRAVILIRSLKGKECVADFQVKKLISNAILAAFRHGHGPDSFSFATPFPGMCSTLEVNERVVELPEYEESKTIAMLICFARDKGCSIPDDILDSLTESEDVSAKMIVASNACCAAIGNGMIAGLPAFCVAGFRALKAMPEGSEWNVGVPDQLQAFHADHAIFGDLTLVAGMLAALQKCDVGFSQTLGDWQTDMTNDVEIAEFQGWFSSRNALIELPIDEVERIFLIGGIDRSLSYFAAAVMVGSSDRRLETYFMAGFLLFRAFQKSAYNTQSCETLFLLLRVGMLKIASRPFSLPTPRTTVPQIQRICEAVPSPAATASLLLFIYPFSNVKCPANMIVELRNAADELGPN